METSEFSAGIAVDGRPGANRPPSSLSPSPPPQTRSPMGGDQTFSLTVANAGPDPATGVQLVVTPPAGATFVSATGGVTPVGGTLTFDLGTLANRASVTVSVTVRPDAPGTLVGTATVTSSSPTPRRPTTRPPSRSPRHRRTTARVTPWGRRSHVLRSRHRRPRQTPWCWPSPRTWTPPVRRTSPITAWSRPVATRSSAPRTTRSSPYDRRHITRRPTR